MIARVRSWRRRLGRALAAGCAAATSLVLAASCKDPTEVVVEARSDVPYAPGRAVAFTVGLPGEIEGAAPTTVTSDPWTGQVIGTLGVVPAASDDGALAVDVVMGVTRAPTECTIASPDGCIFARRRLHYVPHATLRLPVSLFAVCIGVPCDASSTCNALGQCVSADVDPATCDEPTGCTLPGGPDVPEPGDGGDAAARDGAPGANDAAADAVTDADASGSDGSAHGGGHVDGGTPGTVRCPPMNDVVCPTSMGCCTDRYTTGKCNAKVCPVGSNFLKVYCDGDEDCPGGQFCCQDVNTNVLACQAATCGADQVEICFSGAGCSSGTCKNTSNFYDTCEATP